MPTIIDELVVRLGLDSSEFDEGEARLVSSLRRMENAAQRGGRQVVDRVGQNTVAFFRAIENPISGLRRQFEAMATWTERPRENLRQLSEQGQKTGQDVERGAIRGAVGLRALGVAGLAAFAAYETLSKAMSATASAAGGVFQTGLLAGAAGMNVSRFHATALALRTLGNVPLEQTEQMLAGYEQLQQRAPFDPAAGQQMADLMRRLVTAGGRLGIQTFGIDPFHDSPQEYFEKLARGFAQQPDAAQRAAAGAILNLDPQLAEALSRAGRYPGGPGAAVAEQLRNAVTDDQLRKADQLTQAINEMAAAWERLRNAFLLGGLAETLTNLANTLAQLMTPVQGDTRGFLQRLISPGQFPRTGTPTGPLADVVAGGGTGQLVDYITRHEGGSPAGVRNNPGNIKYTGQPGQTDSGVRARDGGTFASYATPEEGHEAIAAQIRRAASGMSTAYGRSPTVDSFLRTYSGGGYGAGPSVAGTPPGAGPSVAGTPPGGQTTVQSVDQWLGTVFDKLGVYRDLGLDPAKFNRQMSTIRGAQAAAATVPAHHRHGDFNMHGNIVVNAPTREGEDIAAKVTDRIQQLTSRAARASAGLE